MTAPRPALLTPAEVGRLFGVAPTTVTKWAKAGRLTAIRTPGGQRRFDAAQPMIAAAIAYRDGGRS